MTDGLYFIDNEVIHIASHLHIELKAISTNFGENAIKSIVPHITKIMNQLNVKCKEISDLEKELSSRNRDLEAAENRVQTLNCSFREKSVECNLLEDESTEIIMGLKQQCKELTEQNLALSDRIKENVQLDVGNIDKLLVDNKAKVEALGEERKCLLTTIEVLEAELVCLRAQIAGLEARVNYSVGTLTPSPATLSETPLMDLGVGPDDLCGGDVSGCCDAQSTVNLEAPNEKIVDNVAASSGKMLIIGDSLVRQASLKCVYKGAMLECCPGARIVNVKERLLNYVNQDLSFIHFHVGTNNLRRGYRGGPGYNGGHGKNRLSTLEIMCHNFGVTFVEANCWVARRDLGRDGRHLNRRGVARLAALFEAVMDFGLRLETEHSAAVYPLSSISNSQTPPIPGNGQ
ncbi:hypothetical protein J6590_095121 [Homalodisca vitripennis]|nr:hypothetical protein J6590_095121 [Homalodisca vitripennis]